MAPAPAVERTGAGVGYGATKAVDDGYLRHERAQEMHMPQMQGRVDLEPKMPLGAGASGASLDVDAPPSYDEVLRKH